MYKRRFKRSININIKKSNIYFIIFFAVIIYTISLINFFSNNVSPKLLKIADAKINEITVNIINESFSKEILGDLDINNIIIINKNTEDEIIALDFNLNNAYTILRKATKSLQTKINNLENGNYRYLSDTDEYYLDAYSDKGFIFRVPVGLATNKVFLSSLGPKIPVRLEFIGSVHSSIVTSITDYGINNSLVEVYAKVELVEEIILPVKSKKNSVESKVLISSKVIQGKVPTYYNGKLENSTNILTTPIK